MRYRGGVTPDPDEPRPGERAERDASDDYENRMTRFYERQQDDHDREYMAQRARRARPLPPSLRGLDEPDRVEDE